MIVVALDGEDLAVVMQVIGDYGQLCHSGRYRGFCGKLDDLENSHGLCGTSYDNALVETINDLYTTGQSTNYCRLLELVGNMPPAELEEANYRQREE